MFITEFSIDLTPVSNVASHPVSNVGATADRVEAAARLGALMPPASAPSTRPACYAKCARGRLNRSSRRRE
jgi:hypothetical protein